MVLNSLFKIVKTYEKDTMIPKESYRVGRIGKFEQLAEGFSAMFVYEDENRGKTLVTSPVESFVEDSIGVTVITMNTVFRFNLVEEK